MKSTSRFRGSAVTVAWAAVILFAGGCSAPPSTNPAQRRPGPTSYTGPAPTYGAEIETPRPAANNATPYSPGSPSGGTLPPPDGELLYQRHASGPFGSSTHTSRTQIRGPVTEEVYIGDQLISSPSGITSIYDPRTGRRITVSRQ